MTGCQSKPTETETTRNETASVTRENWKNEQATRHTTKKGRECDRETEAEPFTTSSSHAKSKGCVHLKREKWKRSGAASKTENARDVLAGWTAKSKERIGCRHTVSRSGKRRNAQRRRKAPERHPKRLGQMELVCALSGRRGPSGGSHLRSHRI